MAGRAGSILAAATRGGGGRMERWGQPLRVIAQDYVEVTKDAYKDAKAKPIKTLVYTLIGGCLVATWKTRPDADSYIDCLLENCNEFHLCSQVVRSRQTQEYLENIATKHSKDEVVYKNFGFFGIVLEREHTPVCKNYHMTCKYIRMRWWTRWTRVVDFGMWGRWWALNRAMVGYDVNDEELTNWLEQQKKF